MKKRKRRVSGAKKTWRFIKKQRRRRKRMHPTRRRQENVSLLFAAAALPLLLFVGLPAAVMAGVASGFVGFASKASPPPKSTDRKRQPKRIKGDEKFSGNFSGKEAIKLKKKSMSCSDPCKYSTHPKDTCDCACNGSQHGIWAWGPSGTTTPNKVRKRRAPAQKRTRRQVRG